MERTQACQGRLRGFIKQQGMNLDPEASYGQGCQQFWQSLIPQGLRAHFEMDALSLGSDLMQDRGRSRQSQVR